jgi:flavin reductase (DIM6/NTAB) family NADH-FMN oxidoreductase RutF
MHVSPSSLSVEDRYKLLIGAIVPRPIALVSTIAPASSPAPRAHNLAPFSFFAGVSANPMTLLFCPANTPDGHEKDSLRNAKPVGEGGGGEFVVNIVPHALAHQMASCAEELPFGDSEFALSGLTPAPCRVVSPPRVLESPVSFECRTTQVVRTNPGQPSGGNVVIGEVVMVHVREDVRDERGRIDPAALDAVGRMAGLTYCTTRDRFEIPWGRKALG